jgi:8-oxo-dGTP pyrophosphatase MutT (NUDIX family)
MYQPGLLGVQPGYFYFCGVLTFIHQVKQALQKPLPGALAHRQMSPGGRGDTESYLTNLKEPAKISAVMLLLFEEEGEPKMVLTKRHTYAGVHSGQISFPGGKYEPQDTDYIHTAYRETYEEVGIPKDEIILVGSLSRIYIPPSNFLVYPFVGFCPAPPLFKTDPIEVERLILPPVKTLLADEIVQEGTFKTGGQTGWEINAPYYAIENEKVWGATAAILSEFKAILSTL